MVVWPAGTGSNSAMKLLSLYCRVTVALLMVVGCGGERALEAGVRVGLITPGSIADAAWNAGAYRGLQWIADSLGLHTSHVEARTPGAQEEALRTYAAQGYQLVFGHGFEFQDPAERVARDYPETVVARDVAGGTFVPQVQSFGLASGVISYRPNPAATRALPPGLGEWMDAVRDSIVRGTLSPLTAPAGDVP